MRNLLRRVPHVFSIVLAVCSILDNSIAAAERAVRVTLDPEVASQPITGRLYLFFSQQKRSEPMRGPNWFRPEPFFGLDVKDFAPGSSVTIDDTADGFPGPLSALPAGTYRVQALLDHDFYHQDHAKGAGNLYSDVVDMTVDDSSTSITDLTLSHVIEPAPYPQREGVEEVIVHSDLLSAFHHRDVVERATVVLPESYASSPDRRYPVIYIIPGFGGSYRDLHWFFASPDKSGDAPQPEFIRVMLSGDCKWGHHVYADSATNGPRGKALIEEIIPYIDRTYRTIPESTGRFVTGHSSGGWSSLWLQVTYPEFFGGVWSTSPDPVDFHDYQNVNLYADPPLSLYRDESGERRPLARVGGRPVILYETFGHMDDVIGRGGQLRSFEAVFSPLGAHGLPRKLWDRKTGVIDPEVAQAWRAYDIREKIERDWPRLKPLLEGKLHVTTGSLDTFYLEGAVKLLGESLKKLGSDAEIVIVEGKDHRTILSQDLREKINRQMNETFLRRHKLP